MTFHLGVINDALTDALGDRVAIVQGDRRVTYREIGGRSRQLAHLLHARGFGCHGEHEEMQPWHMCQDAMAICMMNRPEYPEAMFGAFKSRVVPWYFGEDDETVLGVIMRLLGDKRWTIGTAESMTGGLVIAALTSQPGSSEFVRGAIVAYDSELKDRLLGVSDISEVVNAETAIEMANGGRKLLDTDVVVAVTGSAGPEPMEKPPGTVYIAVATPEDVRAQELRMPGDRERVLVYGTTSALHLARLAISGKWWT